MVVIGRLLLVCLFVLSCSVPTARAAERPAFEEGESLNPDADFLADPTGVMKIEDILRPDVQSRFVAGQGKSGLGLTGVTFWVRLRIVPPASAAETPWLLLDPPYQDDLRLYFPDGGGDYHERLSGALVPFAEGRDLAAASPAFQLPSFQNQPMTVYLRLKSYQGIAFELSLWHAESLRQHLQNKAVLLNILYGIVIGLLFYNLFLAISLRDRAYLAYVAMVLASLLFITHINGDDFMYLWPHAPALQMHCALPLGSLWACCAGLFALQFLELSDTAPRVARVVIGYVLAMPVLNLLYFAGFPLFAAFVYYASGLPWLALLYGAAIYRLRQGFVPAGYALIGYTVVIAAVIIYFARLLGVFQPGVLSEHAIQFGATFETVIFSLALAVRIRLLQETREQLKLFIRQTPVSVAMFDRQLRYLAYSNLWLEQHDCEGADLAGRHYYSLHLDIPEAWKAANQQGLAGQSVRKDNDLWQQADGSSRWLNWVVQPWTDAGGRIGGIIVSAEDITPAKRALEETRIAAVAFQSRDGMIVTDAHGTVLRVNDTFTRMMGYGEKEVIGNTPSMWNSRRQDPVFFRNMWEAIRHEGRWEGSIWNRRKDGAVFPACLTISSVCDETSTVTHYVGTYSDIRDPKEAERKILDLAFYDSLTNLPNRRLMLDRLQHALASAARSNQTGAVLLFDLDNVKTINDTLGHDAGDELLVAVAQRLRHSLREVDTAARLGGDEFVVLLEHLAPDASFAATTVKTVAEKLRNAIAEPFQLKGAIHHITCSIGVTLFHSREQSVETCLKQADLALYQAKDAGRNTVRFFNPSMQAAVEARAQLCSGLRRALVQNEFVLHYQPQVDADGRLTGAEALIRWHPPDGSTIAPLAFIQAAEESGLIVPVGEWVIKTACQQLCAWKDDASTRELIVSINMSARQFRQTDLVDRIKEALKEGQFDPGRLRIELTESVLLQEVEEVIRKMHDIRQLGVRFSIDDFGTGYSSLAYLRRLPLDELKIDRSFVEQVDVDREAQAIVKAIVSLGGSLNLQVIAEGVETEAQRDALSAVGCRAYQGFLFGRPGPSADIEGRLRASARNS